MVLVHITLLSQRGNLQNIGPFGEGVYVNAIQLRMLVSIQACPCTFSRAHLGLHIVFPFLHLSWSMSMARDRLKLRSNASKTKQIKVNQLIWQRWRKFWRYGQPNDGLWVILYFKRIYLKAVWGHLARADRVYGFVFGSVRTDDPKTVSKTLNRASNAIFLI